MLKRVSVVVFTLEAPHEADSNGAQATKAANQLGLVWLAAHLAIKRLAAAVIVVAVEVIGFLVLDGSVREA